ncbi:hypothetical protein [Lactococcus lactis]|uniref:hypothetical protein n=1 Tax=Lactococcus lactis TaxID=1358 RepID=UPI00071D5B91|nr:hypothetical protein [Lactococcus lactis]
MGTIKVYRDEHLYLKINIDFENRRVIAFEFFKEDSLISETFFEDKIIPIIRFIIRNFRPRKRVIDVAKTRFIKDVNINH